MVETVVQQLGRLDIAINNAGMNKNHAAEECTEADWDQTFELNTKGVFLCCQVLSPHLASASASCLQLGHSEILTQPTKLGLSL